MLLSNMAWLSNSQRKRAQSSDAIVSEHGMRFSSSCGPIGENAPVVSLEKWVYQIIYGVFIYVFNWLRSENVIEDIALLSRPS